jgi:uncharacterized repeat protein (TIGR01451 family)
MGLTVNKRTISGSIARSAAAARSVAVYGIMRVFCMVSFIIARFTGAGRSRVYMNAGSALCAPGSFLYKAGSRLTQKFIFGNVLRLSGLLLPSLLMLGLLVSTLIPSVALAVPAGTLITNTAQADYILNGNPQTAYSNSVNISTVLIGSPSVLELFRYSPSSPSMFLTVGITPYFDGGGFTPAPAPSDPATGSTINLGAPVPLEPSANFSQGDPVFILLTDPDGNSDPAVANTIVVTIEDSAVSTIETLLLTETGVDTGAFSGYIRSGALVENPDDGTLYGFAGAQFSAQFTDPTDPPDTSSAPFLFDAAGVLWVTAMPGTSTVSAGDYLTYTLTVENTSGTTVPGTILTTDLPVGFRYETGSTRTDGTVSPDPLTAPDGRSLAFSVGDIAPGGTVTITFVARVGAGARPGKAVAPNVASSGILVSNTAMATVRIAEELFRSRNVIMGRVLSGVCGEEGTEGVAGIRVFLEDGTYVVTDEKGRYHFEGVRSGTHVLQLDLETVPEMYEVVMCDDDTRQAGRPWSRFVDLAGGSLWRVDYYLTPKDPEEGSAVLVLKTVAEQDRVTFSANIKGEQVPLKNVRFKVTLPEGVEYEIGTARLEGKSIEDPQIQGSALIWNVGDVPGGWEKGISFETKIREGFEWTHEGGLNASDPEDGNIPVKYVQGKMTEVTSSASVTFDTPVQKDISTPEVKNVLLKVAEREETKTKKFVFRPHFGTLEASLSAEDREALDILSALFDPAEIGRVKVTGHTDSIPISARGRRLYADNYELSKARARTMARYLRSVWNLPSGVFAIEGKGPDDPLATNDTVSGRTLNRRVEVNVITTTIQKRTELQPINDQNMTEIVIKGLRPGEGTHPGAGLIEMMKPQMVENDPFDDMAWFESANGKLEWVWPFEGFSPAVPVTKVAVKHKPGSRVVLMVNGEKVNPLSFEGTTSNDLKRSALSVWRGVRLTDGDNHLEAIQYGKNGRKLGSVERSVYLAGRPVKAIFVPEQSKLIADGRTPPQIAVKLTDSKGKPARPGLVGQYSVISPHRVWEQVSGSQNDPQDPNSSKGQFLIGGDGTARLFLQPTVRSGEAVLKVGVRGKEEKIRVWLTAQRKEWILVGLAEGTVGYNTVSGNLQSLEDSGSEEDLYTDGRTAFFAKGKIKGEYLLTMQYDTAGPHGAAGDGLHGTIDPDTYYTLYGDLTEQDYEAPTSKKLYLKIEKSQFYALFGDTSSGMTVTELSKYDRRFTGLRSQYQSQAFSYNLFASETEQGFVKDEIPGDGTSGLYRLSNGDVVVNSESVRIEVRDRFQSHVILSVQEMARHTDYNIDYDEGTLFFKSPIPQRDSGFNPVYIVAQYETSDLDATGITYGARGEVVVPGSQVTIGVSHIHEDRGDDEGNLLGLDVTAKLSERFTLTAETASTSNETLGNDTDGSAYILELTHESLDFTGKAYLREQEVDFGLGHQRASEAGVRKAGVDAEFSLTESLSVRAEAFRQENIETGAERQVEELGASLDSGNTRYLASVRQATDTDSNDTVERSQQLTAGVKWHSEDNRWDLRADQEQSIGDNDNTDYPTRTLLGADYRLSDNVSVYAEQEYTDGEETSVSSTRVGMKATPWEGGSASSTVDRKYDENGERVYATTGLNQTWQVSERWVLSAGFEGATVLKENLSEPFNDDTPPASSEEDYAAVSVGAGYTLEKWDFDVRLEARGSDSSDKWGVISGLFGEPADGIGISTDLKHFRTEADTGIDTKETDLRLGFAYRPFERKWTLLDRLEYSVEEDSGGTTDLTVWKLVNNFNANLKVSDDLQVSFQYGAKYVKDTIEGQVFSGFTQLLGAEGRYDLTPRWDVGAWTSILTAIDAGTTDYGVGASLGYGLMENMWLSFGYNLHGFTDSDFSQGDFTAQGPFVKFRFKFDQNDLRSILK